LTLGRGTKATGSSMLAEKIKDEEGLDPYRRQGWRGSREGAAPSGNGASGAVEQRCRWQRCQWQFDSTAARDSGEERLRVGRPSTNNTLFNLFKDFQTYLNLKRSKMVFSCSNFFKQNMEL
jgi:hypothetical protein